jgi:GAF domain-containing protein
MVLLGEDSFNELLDRVIDLAVQTLPSATFASITVSDRTGVHTSHSTGADALAADQAQYEEGGGPCLQALRTSEQVDLAIAEADKWPTFKAKAQELGVTRVLSTPLIQRDSKLGALNIYTDSENGLTPRDRRIATLFAGQASAVLSNAQALMTATDMAKQLEQALASREIIGEAKGILMERESCDRDQAFDILRRASQRENRKLRDLAEELVAVVEARSRKK